MNDTTRGSLCYPSFDSGTYAGVVAERLELFSVIVESRFSISGYAIYLLSSLVVCEIMNV